MTAETSGRALRPVLVTSSLTAGGSAKAALRLLRGLRKIGVEAQLLGPQRSTGEEGVVGLFSARERCLHTLVKGSEIALRAFYRSKKDVPFTSAWLGVRIHRKLRELKADSIHLNQCHNGFLGLETPGRWSLPAVWTVHDWWPITGGCHFPGHCGRHATGCGACPVLGSGRNWDLSRLNYRVKARAWSKTDASLVAVSRSIRTSLQSSPLFVGREVEVVPNGLDLETFRPIPREVARSVLGLPADATILLFGARRSDVNKGFGAVEELARELGCGGDAARYLVVTFGDNRPLKSDALEVAARSFGLVDDDLKLALLYSAANFTLVPSRQESFGLVAAESMACGTPVLAYRTTGLVDIVDHRENGFLAEPDSITDYIAGARWLLQAQDEETRRAAISAHARSKVRDQFDILQVARRYAHLYSLAVQRRRMAAGVT